jgi:CheY-like chemotaxis protein
MTTPPVPLPLCVVIADDNPDHANSLAALVEMWGHFTHVVQDAHGALATCGHYRPDVLLLDIGFPLCADGLGVAREIRRASPPGELAIVAVTGHDESEMRQQAAEAGFDHYFVKPVDLQRLHDLLAAVQARQSAEGVAPPLLGTPAKTSSDPQKKRIAGAEPGPGA